jgi:hypothetical protein
LTGEHVYRVHPINAQLVTDPVIMQAKEEHESCPTDLEAEVLWSGLKFVMMIALGSKSFKEHIMP